MLHFEKRQNLWQYLLNSLYLIFDGKEVYYKFKRAYIVLMAKHVTLWTQILHGHYYENLKANVLSSLTLQVPDY